MISVCFSLVFHCLRVSFLVTKFKYTSRFFPCRSSANRLRIDRHSFAHSLPWQHDHLHSLAFCFYCFVVKLTCSISFFPIFLVQLDRIHFVLVFILRILLFRKACHPFNLTEIQRVAIRQRCNSFLFFWERRTSWWLA